MIEIFLQIQSQTFLEPSWKKAELLFSEKTFQTTRQNKQFVYHCTKNKFSIKDFFSKCEQICRKLRICSHLLKKSLMENFIFCAVYVVEKAL